MSCFDCQPDPVEIDPFAWDDTELEEESPGRVSDQRPQVNELNTQADQLRLEFAPEVWQVVRGCMRPEEGIHGA